METTKPSGGAALHSESEEERREAASVLGKARTPAKVAASVENGKKGGRPKGIAQSPETKEKIRMARLATEAARKAAKQ